ncbi:MAG: Mrp/NBP35 family ATP-binding protein [Candidatus Thermoplasmatota archaeon]|nr:Mrp/NBP35 family ATP-binding protein [Candidatus Thermoplasmatota archaeon]
MVMNKIVVMSGKGGVGKSTVAANLAFKFASEGKKVGIFDSDFHGPSIPQMLGVKEDILGARDEKNIEPVEVDSNLKVVSMEFLLPDDDSAVIWRGPMKMKAIKQFVEQVNWGDIDYLIIDLPPGTGDEPLSIAQQIPELDGSVIVTTPQEVAVQAVKKSISFSEKLDLGVLGVIENMSGLTCPNCGEEIEVFGSGGGKEMAEKLDVPFLGEIPLDPEIMASGEEGEPFFGKSAAYSESFEDIVEKLLERLGE